ncbi:MAG: hypothetical protein K0041_03270 [Acidithiobacillus sp.]|nr:hypothetical protein [Acidithiobacillus sp.]
MRNRARSLLWVAMGIAMAGCGAATNNGLPMAGPSMPALPQPPQVSPPRYAVTPYQATAPARTVPAPQPTVRAPTPSIHEETLPVTPLVSLPSTPSTSIPSTPSTFVTESTASLSASNFRTSWQKDLGDARERSSACVGQTGGQREQCWQALSSWANGRSSVYGQASKVLDGAQAQQANAAQKFFETTAQWASACSTLSTSACAQSPLIAKIKQWKNSVGIGSGE